MSVQYQRTTAVFHGSLCFWHQTENLISRVWASSFLSVFCPKAECSKALLKCPKLAVQDHANVFGLWGLSVFWAWHGSRRKHANASKMIFVIWNNFLNRFIASTDLVSSWWPFNRDFLGKWRMYRDCWKIPFPKRHFQQWSGELEWCQFYPIEFKVIRSYLNLPPPSTLPWKNGYVKYLEFRVCLHASGLKLETDEKL